MSRTYRSLILVLKLNLRQVVFEFLYAPNSFVIPAQLLLLLSLRTEDVVPQLLTRYLISVWSYSW